MNERNVAASVRARLLNRARETKQDFSLVPIGARNNLHRTDIFTKHG